MRTIEEQIEIMRHYANGGEIEIFTNEKWGEVTNSGFANWNFAKYDFRIKEQKKTIIIEKWLCEYNGCEELKGSKRFFIIEKVFPFEAAGKKIKLLETYEVEL